MSACSSPDLSHNSHVRSSPLNRIGPLHAVIVPRSQLPAGLSHLAGVLPSGALGDGLRAAFVHGRLAGVPLLVLLAWALVATVLASRTFRWSD